MKHCLVTLAAFSVAVTAFAQGTVNFNNRIVGQVDARAAYDGGFADQRFVAQLYASTAGGAYAAVGDPIVFRSTSEAAKGYFSGAVRTVPTAGPTALDASVKIVAWASSLGSTYEAAQAAGLGGWGESGAITMKLGGPTDPPPNLIGTDGVAVSGFTIRTIVPEPSVAALGLLGAGLLLIRRKK